MRKSSIDKQWERPSDGLRFCDRWSWKCLLGWLFTLIACFIERCRMMAYSALRADPVSPWVATRIGKSAPNAAYPNFPDRLGKGWSKDGLSSSFVRSTRSSNDMILGFPTRLQRICSLLASYTQSYWLSYRSVHSLAGILSRLIGHWIEGNLLTSYKRTFDN